MGSFKTPLSQSECANSLPWEDPLSRGNHYWKKLCASTCMHVCMYMRFTLTLQHVSLLTLEGFLVVPTAVEINKWCIHSVRLESIT